MNFLARWLQRIGTGLIAILAMWFIVTQIFLHLNARLPLLLALSITYLLSAYILLPLIVHVGLTVVRRGRIPEVTRAFDGLPEDPVNIILIGSEDSLLSAFEKAGWHEADRLNLKTSWKMVVAYLLNKPYPTAPFRPLYLFARHQDHGFQEPIGKSPRKRHHIRLWAMNVDSRFDTTDFKYWSTKHEIDPTLPIVWVGAGTKDVGIGLTSLTYQIIHRTDKDLDEEREHILQSLRDAGVIKDEHYVESDRLVDGRYVSDGRILTAKLID